MENLEERLQTARLLLKEGLNKSIGKTLEEGETETGETNLRDALLIYDDVLRADPTNVRVLSERGLVNVYLKRPEEALNDNTKAIEIEPENPALYLKRAGLFNVLGRSEEAAADATKAIGYSSEGWLLKDAYVARGLALVSLRRYNDAIGDLTTAITLDPSDSRPKTYRAAAYIRIGRFEEAAADSKEAIQLNPEDSEAHTNLVNLAFACDSLGRFEDAVDAATKAIDLNTGHSGGYVNRGSAFNSLRRFPEAVADLGNAIKLDPGYAAAYGHRGNSYRLTGNNKSAEADYRTAIGIFERTADPGVDDYRWAIRAERGLGKLGVSTENTIELRGLGSGVVTRELLDNFFRYEA